MKVAPVSGDLIVKLGIGAVLFGGLAMLIYTWKSQASAAAGAAANAVGNAMDAVNPSSADNLVYSSYNNFAGAILPDSGPGRNADGSWSLGGFLYDITHPITAIAVSNATNPTPIGGGRTTQITPIGPQYDQMGNVIYN